MHEDKLTQDQRIRLEALAQAVTSLGAHVGKSVIDRDVIYRARQFETFIRGDDNGTDQADR